MEPPGQSGKAGSVPTIASYSLSPCVIFDFLAREAEVHLERNSEVTLTLPDESTTNETMATLADMMNASPDELARYYDQWSGSYDHDLANIGYIAPAVAAETLGKQVEDRTKPILDAGCGTGLTGLQLHKCGFDCITGLDISTASLEKARQKGCYRELKQQNLNEPLDFADDRFAAAQCVGTLTYVRNVGGLMREFCRVVRPGGVVLFTHRTDLYDARFKSVIDEISAVGLWTPILHSEPSAYLPGHADFGDEKTIVYDMYRVDRH